MELLHGELTHQIIGAAMEVHSLLKLGLDEKIYENALKYELLDQGLTVNSQTIYPVNFKGRKVGELIPDLVVNDLIIVETKVVTEFVAAHYSQVLGYLNITNLDVGLLLNFKHNSLQHKRVITHQKPPNLHQTTTTQAQSTKKKNPNNPPNPWSKNTQPKHPTQAQSTKKKKSH